MTGQPGTPCPRCKKTCTQARFPHSHSSVDSILPPPIAPSQASSLVPGWRSPKGGRCVEEEKKYLTSGSKKPGRDWGRVRTMALAGQSWSPEGAALTLNKCSTLEWAWMAPLGTTSCSPNPRQLQIPHTKFPSELSSKLSSPIPQRLNLRPRYSAGLPLGLWCPASSPTPPPGPQAEGYPFVSGDSAGGKMLRDGIRRRVQEACLSSPRGIFWAWSENPPGSHCWPGA